MNEEIERLTEARERLAAAYLTGTLRKSKNPATVEVPLLDLDEAIDAMFALEQAFRGQTATEGSA